MAGSIFDTRPQDVDMSMLAATSTTPDAHAKVMDMSSRLGVAPDLVARNPQWAERQLNQTIDSEALIKSHPATAKYLSDPNNASVSQDEIVQHMAIEDTLRDAELLEPGLFTKSVRDTLVAQLREKGRKIEFVDTPSEWFKSPFALPPGAPLGSAAMASSFLAAEGIYEPVPQGADQTPAPTAAPAPQATTELPTKPMGGWERLATGAAKGEQIPFLAAIPEINQVAELTAIAYRLKDKTATDEDMLKLLEYDAEMRRGTTFGGQVAGILSQVPAFAGEFAATGGLYTAGRKAARGAGLYVAKKLLNKSVREVAESAILRSGVKLSGWAVGSAARAVVGMPQRVALDTMQRLVPQMQFTEDEQGQIEAEITNPDDGFAAALGKAVLSQSIEAGTEVSGELFKKIGSAVGKKVGLDGVKAAVMTRWFKLHPTSGWSQFQALLRKGGYSGILEEFGEERLGDILRAAAQLEEFKVSPEQYMTELVAFAALPAAGLAVNLPGMVRYSNRMAQQAQAHVDYYNELGQQSLSSKTRERVPGLLSYLGTLATQDGPVESVFHPVETWDTYWATKQVDPRQATIDLLGSAEAYDSAKATGHDIEIPLASYVEKIAPTEHNAAMSQELRLGAADAPNVREMAAGTQAVQQQLQELLKLNQDSEALTTEQGAIVAEIAQLEQQIQEAQAAQPVRQQRLQEIAAQIPEALAAVASGQAAPADMQALVGEYQSLQEQENTAQAAQQRLQELGARQQEITAQVEQIQQRERDARQTGVNVAPEVRAMADTTFDTLMSTGRYKSERAARAHAAIYSRMAYVQSLRNGMTLEEFNERFPLEITGEQNNESNTLNQSTDGQPTTGDRGGGRAPGEYSPLAGAPKITGATGPDIRLNAVAEKYARDNGIPARRQAVYAKVDPERAARIASAYEEMQHAPQDPAVKEAYAEMMRQVRAQYDALIDAGYVFWFMDPETDPYEGNPWSAMRDLRGNQRMAVFPTEAGFGSADADLNVDDNPLLADTGLEWSYGTQDGPAKRVLANDLFRAVHDAFGHGLEGAGFRADGEENAWQAHVRLFTGSAVAAMTSETRGQNSWVNFGPYGEQNKTAKVNDTAFAVQKTGLMPAWTATDGVVKDEAEDSILPQQQRDAEYMAAVEAGDMETAQRLVDEAAKAAGYMEAWNNGASTQEIEGGVVRTPFMYFTDTKENAEAYSWGTPNRWFIKTNPFPATEHQDQFIDFFSPESQRFIPDTADEEDRAYKSTVRQAVDDAIAEAQQAGFDGIEMPSEWDGKPWKNYVVFDPSQIKSAEPVTRDADGNVISLSERFNTEQDSILYQDETLAKIDAEAQEAAANDEAPAADIVQSDVPQSVDEASKFESVFRLASSKLWARGRDLKLAIQAAVLGRANDAGVNISQKGPQAVEYLVRVGLSDALSALKQNPNAIGWYDKKTRQALAAMALVHPEIGADENARFAFVWALAVTSNGLEVGKNFELAEKVYTRYKATGVMPTDIQAGTAQKAINKNLGLFNNLRKLWGIDNLRLFMQTNFTVGEITALDPDLQPGGEWADTVVRGAAILGPKIGNGFFSNLYGFFDALTMDRWLIRTWGRWTGTLVEIDEAKLGLSRTRLTKAVAALSESDVARIAQVIEMDSIPEDMDVLAARIAKASQKKELRSTLNETPAGEELRKAGNSLASYLDGQKESPGGPAERNFIRGVFAQILAELQTREEYKDLTMADLQAVLWYGEKRLYEFAKEDNVDGEDAEGYEDDDAPDYANAAASVARSKGVSDRKIKAAFKRIEDNGRTAGARPGDGATQSGQQGGEQAEARGFTQSERRQFRQTVAVKRIRLGRGSSKAEPFVYTRKSVGDGGAVRALKKLGVSYVAQVKAGASLRRILRNSGGSSVDEQGKPVYAVDAPNFVELTAAANSAQKFAGLVSASKVGNKFGAAVYVYPEVDYQSMRLFLSEDGATGFALKSSGDIVSVFSSGGAGRAALEAAIAMGGNKLDAFDTILPHYYSAHGFVSVSRRPWDDAQTPEGWDTSVFKDFNNGKPDVVFMVLDPRSMAPYAKTDGRYAKTDDAAVKLQAKSLKQIAQRDAAAGNDASTADDEATLNQSVFPELASQQAQQQRDAEYMAAVEAGDMETAQRLVDEAAKAAGYTESGSHGLGRGELADNRFKPEMLGSKTKAPSAKLGFFFASTDTAKSYAKKVFENTLSDTQASQIVGLAKDILAPVLDLIPSGTHKEIDSFRDSDPLSALDKKTISPGTFLEIADTYIYNTLNVAEFELGALSKDASIKQAVDEANKRFELEFQKLELRKPAIINVKLMMQNPAVYDQQGKVQREVAYVELIKAALDAGHDSVIIKNTYDGGPLDDVKVVFDPSQIKSAEPVTRDADGNVIPLSERFNPEQDSILFQRKDNARGSITFRPSERGADQRRFTMRLLKTANESTFIHEAAHYFLETMGELASREGAPEQSKADYAAVMKWLGATDPTSITVEQHETFARSFEAYLMEGKAPAEEVRTLFARMRTWLVRIYRDLTNLNVEMSDEIRGVFDRMVATDTEIQAAEAQERVEPMFGTKPEGMTDQAWERYRKAVEKASMAARESLQARLEKEVLDARTAQRRDEMDLTRAEVLDEYVRKPEYIALHILRFGKMPDGGDIPDPLQAIKLDKESLMFMPSVDKPTMDKLRKLGVYRVEGGVSPDAAAQMLGFESGDELVRSLAETAPLKQAVEEETKRRVEAMHPSLLTDPESIKAEAVNAVHNEYRDEVIASEMAELQRLIRADKAAVGRVAAMAPAPLGTIGQRILRGNQDQASAAMQLQDPRLIQKITQDMAGQMLAGMKLRDIRPSLYLAASRRAAMRGSMASAKGNYSTALAAKEQELLNHALYREAKRLQEDATKQSKYLLRLDSPAAQARLGKAGANYRDQVNAILERFNFKAIPLTQVDRRQRLAEWITSQESAGFTVDIDDSVRDEAFRKDYREMTGMELAAVYEAVKQIDHLAKLKNKLLKARDQQEFDELMATLVAQVRANTKAKPRQMGSKTSGEQAMESWDGFFAAHRKMASIIREMDGFVDAGPLYWAIMDPINTAGNEEAVENEKATVKLQELFAAYSNEELKRMTKKQVVQGATRNFNLSLEDRLCIALNWGNEDNQRKLVDGYNGLTEADVLQILDTLTEKDWKFVQSVWDYIDSFWPRSKAKQERVYGIAPEKVQATPVVTKFGTFPGGYYPLKYAGARAEGESDADTAKQMMRGAMVSGTTRRGHLKERVSGVERPIRLDFGVLTQHLTQTIHDLTHHEMLIDVNKILRNRTLMKAIEEHYGEALFRQLRTGLEAVAAGNVNSEDRFTKALGHLRGGATVAGLGFNLMTSLQQAFGLTNAIPRVGVKYISQAVGRWLGSAKDMENSVAWIHSRSEFMRLRGKTQSRDLAEIRSTINPSARTALMDSYFYLIEKGQMLADVPTWLAGYYKAMDEGMSEAQAIALADQTVIDVHGGGQIKDLAAVQRGGPLLKMWSTFYSYFNAAWNLNVELVKRTNFAQPTDIGRLMVDMLILNSVPVALNYVLVEALRGGAGDDDKNWMSELARRQVSYMLGMLVFVRELGGIFDGRNYEGPAGGRFFAEAYKLAKQVEQGELDRGFWASLNKVGGLVFHYPATQAQRTIEGAKSLWEGKTSNPAVLVTGPSKDQR